MIATEDEAKKKWCPFTRVVNREGIDSSSWNRFQPDDDDSVAATPDGSFCIASACMAWRWVTPVAVNENPTAEFRLFNPTGGDLRGCCGLAGQP